MPSAKKYKQSRIDPDFEENLDIMLKGVVATGKFAFNPSEMGFAGIPVDFPFEPLTTDEVCSNQREMGESSSPSKRPRIGRRNKEKNTFVKTSLNRLIEAFRVPPPAPVSDRTIFECLETLASLPEVVADRRFHAKCVNKLENPTRRQIFMALEPEMRVEYLPILVE